MIRMTDITCPHHHTLWTLVSAVTTITLLYVSTRTHPRDGGAEGCCVDLITTNDDDGVTAQCQHHLLSVTME